MHKRIIIGLRYSFHKKVRPTRAGTLSLRPVATDLTGIWRVTMMNVNLKFTIVPFVLAVQVLSETIIVNTTSGRLLGTQAEGGMHDSL